MSSIYDNIEQLTLPELSHYIKQTYCADFVWVLLICGNGDTLMPILSGLRVVRGKLVDC